jgi:Uma2 family endonuclease
VTAAYDRGAKFASYRKIEALQEFVLIDIEARRVEVFRRQTGNQWLLHDDAGEPACLFESVKLTLGLDAVFEDLDAPAADDE